MGLASMLREIQEANGVREPPTDQLTAHGAGFSAAAQGRAHPPPAGQQAYSQKPGESYGSLGQQDYLSQDNADVRKQLSTNGVGQQLSARSLVSGLVGQAPYALCQGPAKTEFEAKDSAFLRGFCGLPQILHALNNYEQRDAMAELGAYRSMSMKHAMSQVGARTFMSSASYSCAEGHTFSRELLALVRFIDGAMTDGNCEPALVSARRQQALQQALYEQTMTRQQPQPDGSSVMMDVELPDGMDPSDFLQSVAQSTPASRRAATLTYTKASGEQILLHWDDTGVIIQEAAPAIALKLYAVFVSDNGDVLVALTATSEAERAVDRMLASDSDIEGQGTGIHGLMPQDDGALTDAAFIGISNISISGFVPGHGHSSMVRDGIEDSMFVHNQRTSDVNSSSFTSLMWKGYEIRLHGRIQGGVSRMQGLQMRLCHTYPRDSGYLVAIVDGLPGAVADVQLQLTCGLTIVDRYDLSAQDVADINTEISDLIGTKTTRRRGPGEML